MIKKWLIRGDTHGNFNWMCNGVLDSYTPEETAIIILGDAGFNFYLNKQDARKKKEVNARGYHIYCVRGNHEERPKNVKGMKVTYDANVRGWVYMEEEYPNIRYFFDCAEYKLGIYNVAVIGGAYSVDKWYRLQRAGVTSKINPDYHNAQLTGWFPQEQLTDLEMAEGYEFLYGKTFDFVFSHTCPYSWRPVDMFLPFVDQDSVDNSMEKWMDEVKDVIGYYVWCFGHYHADRLERPHVEMYYRDIEELDTVYDRWVHYEETGEVDWWLTKSPNFYQGE